jgi:2-oxoglutarate ferredoxin oxidoreductase subunit beta
VGGLKKKGFAVIDTFSNCHTYFGRFNREGDAVEMIRCLKRTLLPVEAVEKIRRKKEQANS